MWHGIDMTYNTSDIVVRTVNANVKQSASQSQNSSALLDTQRITVLGSTGSIGTSTLDVISRMPECSVFALTANTNTELMYKQCLEFEPCFAVMGNEEAALTLQKKFLRAKIPTEVLAGEAGLCFVASHEEVDTVMAAIVGAAGLLPTLAAVECAKKVLLANKEALIMAGELFVAALAHSGGVLIPIDSEHNAIFQCLPADVRLIGSDIRKHGVRKVVLTASGGPFRDMPVEQLATVTPAQACKHPNWSMGRKISVDSASMMNKGLELIEACFLFGLSPAQIEVLIHPQSIVHSMVEYSDGSVIAQLGSADMRVPISYGLAWPARASSGADFLDLVSSGDLQFYRPDLRRFPCLELGMQAAVQGGTMPAIMNAANEVAVDSFLKGLISFTDIPVIIARVMAQIACSRADTLDNIRGADLEARAMAAEMLHRIKRSGTV